MTIRATWTAVFPLELLFCMFPQSPLKSIVITLLSRFCFWSAWWDCTPVTKLFNMWLDISNQVSGFPAYKISAGWAWRPQTSLWQWRIPCQLSVALCVKTARTSTEVTKDLTDLPGWQVHLQGKYSPLLQDNHKHPSQPHIRIQESRFAH